MRPGDAPRAIRPVYAIRPSIPGMELAIERPHRQYGSAIFVTSGTIVNTTSLTDINTIEILRVDLSGISVASVYKPPDERFSFHQPLTAIGDQQQAIIGDFKFHLSSIYYNVNLNVHASDSFSNEVYIYITEHRKRRCRNKYI